MPILRFAILALLAASPALAQNPANPPPAADQIAAATAPLPEEFRATASVLGYRPGQKGLIQLRSGTGAFNCLADDPAESRFHVACYHRSLEAFMARGRALRAQGHGNQVDSIRNAEIQAGKLQMPKTPAALYSLTAQSGNVSVDAATGTVPGARRLYVVYIPFATAESTGLSTKPAANTPWLMFPGTPRAHIMFVPEMQ